MVVTIHGQKQIFYNILHMIQHDLQLNYRMEVQRCVVVIAQLHVFCFILSETLTFYRLEVQSALL